jgi:hypothetical protein
MTMTAAVAAETVAAAEAAEVAAQTAAVLTRTPPFHLAWLIIFPILLLPLLLPLLRTVMILA